MPRQRDRHEPNDARFPLRTAQITSGFGAKAEEPTTDFLAARQGERSASSHELEVVLSRNGVILELGDWLEGEIAPRAWRALVASRSALARWDELRALVGETGCWPVLIGGPDDEASHLSSIRASESSTDELVAEGLQLDADEWLARENAIDPDLLRELDGGWPTAQLVTETRFRIPQQLAFQRRRAGNVTLFLVETPHSWDVPAALRFGAWNSCPPPQVHVGMLKRWHDRWGAELVGLSRDRLELQVARPPRTRPEALGLAREHFLYCEDSVLHEHESVAALAASLLGNHGWSLGWE